MRVTILIQSDNVRQSRTIANRTRLSSSRRECRSGDQKEHPTCITFMDVRLAIDAAPCEPPVAPRDTRPPRGRDVRHGGRTLHSVAAVRHPPPRRRRLASFRAFGTNAASLCYNSCRVRHWWNEEVPFVTRTRSSLLERVRDFDDASGWEEFDRLYRPLLMKYARKRGLKQDDAEEIVQQCLEVIVTRIRDFQRRKSFRGWLRRIAENKIKHHLDRKHALQRPSVQAALGTANRELTPAELWERQWNRTHLLYCIASLRNDFAAHTLQAFELYVLQDMPVDKVSEALGMSRNQVYVAKSRVMRRIRDRFADMLEALYGVSR